MTDPIFPPELFSKSRRAESPKELMKLAQQYGVELTSDQAQLYHELLYKTDIVHNKSENDVRLINAKESATYGSDGRLKIFKNTLCDYFYNEKQFTDAIKRQCSNCRYFDKVWLKNYGFCNHPINDIIQCF